MGGQPRVRRRHPAGVRRCRLARTTPTSSSPAAPAATARRSTTPRWRSPSPAATDVQPLWISRCFDSVYSVAISESGRLRRRPLRLERVPDRQRPVARPGRHRLRHRPGPARRTRSATQVVNREHLGALDPATGKALEWHPGSDSYEGNKAMLRHPARPDHRRRRHHPGRPEHRPDRVLSTSTASPLGNGVDTAITEPIMGRVVNSGDGVRRSKGTASRDGRGQPGRGGDPEPRQRPVPPGRPDDVLGHRQHDRRDARRRRARPRPPGRCRSPSPGNREAAGHGAHLRHRRRRRRLQAVKKFETFNLDDAPPTCRYTAPRPGTVPTKTFTDHRAPPTDDKGVRRAEPDDPQREQPLPPGRRHRRRRRTTPSGSTPDVPGALSTTWQKEITVPDEGLWKAQIRANDTGGQSSLDTIRPHLDRVRHRPGAGRLDHLAQRGDPADGPADVHRRAGPADHLHRRGHRRRDDHARSTSRW